MLSKEKAEAVKACATPDGFIEPADVVEAARNPEHVLHDEFEWDVQAAAEAHWVETARSLIRFVRIEYTSERATVIAPFYSVDPMRPPRSKRYIELTVAAKDAERAQRVLIDECDRIVSAIRRAQAVAGVLGLSAELESMLANVTTMRSRAERSAGTRRPRAPVARGRSRKAGKTRPARRGRA